MSAEQPDAKRVKPAPEEEPLAASEATQYDRQIRLWGLDAQRRIRGTRLVVVGARGLSAEVCKNLVLAGVKSLRLIDPCNVCDSDLGGGFFYGTADIGTRRIDCCVPKLCVLNPNVDVRGDALPPSSLTKSDIEATDVLCALGQTRADVLHLNALCRDAKVKFFAGNVYGMHGSVFVDLQTHAYLVEREQKRQQQQQKKNKTGPNNGGGGVGGGGGGVSDKRDDEPTMIQSRHEAVYPALADAVAQSWAGRRLRRIPRMFFATQAAEAYHFTHNATWPSSAEAAEEARRIYCADVQLPLDTLETSLVQALASQAEVEMGATCAVVGGVLAGEVIKAVSEKEQPHRNFFVFDGATSSGIVLYVGQDSDSTATASAAAAAAAASKTTTTTTTTTTSAAELSTSTAASDPAAGSSEQEGDEIILL